MSLINPKLAGYTLVVIFSVLILFQLVLVLGISIPGAAWGGSSEALSTELRFASLIAVGILGFSVVVALEKIGVISIIRKPRLINTSLWVFGAYLLLNGIANAVSPGEIERLVMTPLAIISAILCAILAKADAIPHPISGK